MALTITKSNGITKIKESDAKIIYLFPSGTINIRGSVIEFLYKDGTEPTESYFSNIIDNHGQSDVESLVDYWVTNGFFFDPSRLSDSEQNISGIKRFQDNIVVNDQGLTSTATPPYTVSVQDVDYAYIELLTNNGNGFDGANKGAFVCMENNGASLENQHFSLYNWAGGSIYFYADTVESSGQVRFVVQRDGGVQLNGITATEASSIPTTSQNNGRIIYVNTTNLTFLSVGFYGLEAGVWVKL
jgi:hypothetical protein